jgi:two-component system OmpR family response regulator
VTSIHAQPSVIVAAWAGSISSGWSVPFERSARISIAEILSGLEGWIADVRSVAAGDATCPVAARWLLGRPVSGLWIACGRPWIRPAHDDPAAPGGILGAVPEQAVSMQRVLVVDDEHSIVDAVSTALRYEGFDVSTAASGRTALAAVQEGAFDLIVLDVMLPDLDGFEVATRLRADGIDTPVIFLTARTGLDDKGRAFEAGADDYVTKPFSLAEIVMRARAILRRGASRSTDTEQSLSFADLEMDVDAHRTWRAGTELQLTATEFRLLRMFLMNPERVLSKTQILDHVWHYDFDGDSNVLETYVSYLRRKLNELGPPLIHTVRLVGYVLRDESDD